MNDFLQQLRSGHNKRFDKSRRNYDNPQYRNNDRSNQRDRKTGPKRKPFDNEQLQAIKTLLTGIADSQEALLLAAERQADAQERIALSLEVISERLSGVSRETSAEMLQDAPDLPSDDVSESEDSPPQALPENEKEHVEPEKNNDIGRHAAVAFIQTHMADGKSYGEIARLLEENQIPTITGKGAWRAQTVSRVYHQAESSK